LVCFTLHEIPPLSDLRRLNPAHLYRNRLRTAALHYGLINVREDEGFFLISTGSIPRSLLRSD